jgi:hypothetical protein
MLGIVVVAGGLIWFVDCCPFFCPAREEQKQILRAAYPTDDESSAGPQACGAQDDTFSKRQEIEKTPRLVDSHS